MKVKPTLALALGVSLSSYASADTFDLSLTADDGGRWYEYYSYVYAEIGADAGEITNPNSDDYGFIADGFFDIESGNKVGGGVVVFPHGGNFFDVGSLTFDAVSGEITGLTLDFDDYIADDDAITNGGYTTIVSNVEGTVSLADGEVTGIDLTSDVTFRYSFYGSTFNFDGSFEVNSDRFALFVDDSVSALGAAYRLAWDVDGGVNNLAPVPEPSFYAMFLSGLTLVGLAARRRKKSA